MIWACRGQANLHDPSVFSQESARPSWRTFAEKVEEALVVVLTASTAFSLA